MTSKLFVFLCLLLSFVLPVISFGQQVPDKGSGIFAMPSKFLAKLDKKAASLNDKVERATVKSINKLKKREAKLKAELMKKDSSEAMRLFGESEKKYDEMLQKLQNKNFTPLEGKSYDAHLDKLQTALKYSGEGPGAKVAGSSELLQSAKQRVADLDKQFDYTEQIKRTIAERQTYLKQQLSGLGLGKSFLKYSKEAHYYTARIKEYRAILDNPDKLEQKVLGAIQQIPAFTQFMQKHSAFASLFPLPAGGPGGPLPAGTQTLAEVQQLMGARAGVSGQAGGDIVQQQLQSAQTSMSGVQDKLMKKLGGEGGNEDLDFKPNDQKVKPLRQRLELGTNLQTVKATNFFPSTTDIGLSLGYKLNSSGIIGIGMSYKMGWGKSIKHIRLSHEGLSLRSFIDWKLKGSFYITGGYEQNYRASFSSIAQLKGMSGWQQSGLIGISKIVSLKTKFFKKTKAQLLWDMMC